MNVSEQIIQVIDALCNKFGIAMDWTGENVIPYFETLCEKLIKYEIATSLASITFMFLFVIGCIIATKKLHPIFKDGVESYDDCIRNAEYEYPDVPPKLKERIYNIFVDGWDCFCRSRDLY